MARVDGLLQADSMTMMYLRFRGLFAVLALVAALAVPMAAQADSAYDKLDKGPKVGATIPQPFEALDQNDTARNFASLSGERGMVLLFSRSLSW